MLPHKRDKLENSASKKIVTGHLALYIRSLGKSYIHMKSPVIKSHVAERIDAMYDLIAKMDNENELIKRIEISVTN
jgi:hypothetical protein